MEDSGQEGPYFVNTRSERWNTRKFDANHSRAKRNGNAVDDDMDGESEMAEDMNVNYDKSGYSVHVNMWWPSLSPKGATSLGNKGAPLLDASASNLIRAAIRGKLIRGGQIPLSFAGLHHLTSLTQAAAGNADVGEVTADVPGGKVIILSHDDGALPGFYTGIAQYLASYGFVVIGITHTDGSALVDFLPNGDRISYHPLHSSVKEGSMEAWVNVHGRASMRVDDITFVLDKLRQMNQQDDHFLGGKLDFHEVAVVAFGQASSSAVMAGWSDSAISAVACLCPDLVALPAEKKRATGARLIRRATIERLDAQRPPSADEYTLSSEVDSSYSPAMLFVTCHDGEEGDHNDETLVDLLCRSSRGGAVRVDLPIASAGSLWPLSDVGLVAPSLTPAAARAARTSAQCVLNFLTHGVVDGSWESPMFKNESRVPFLKTYPPIQNRDNHPFRM